VKAIPEWPEHHYSDGLTLAIPSVRRNPMNALSPSIKGGNYLNNVLGVLEAQQLGAEDCLLLNQKQYLTEASNSNVLFVIDNAVQTPSVESGNLGGLTKGIVSELCTSAGISFGEALLSVNDIRSATECFVTSATREIVPVKSLRLEDGTLLKFPIGGGNVTKMLCSSYKDYVNRYWQENIDSRLSS
jgi:branched-chain amino acid aminotransferase